jgi:hypothetical protein
VMGKLHDRAHISRVSEPLFDQLQPVNDLATIAQHIPVVVEQSNDVEEAEEGQGAEVKSKKSGGC